MRHNVKGRKLNRTSSHRKALFCNLTGQLIEHKQIVTTLAKAKEARKYAEKMITLGKKGDLNSLRQALKFLRHKKIVFKLFNDIAPNYANRKGGYTRVLKLGTRKGDAAETAVIQLVEFDDSANIPKTKKVEGLQEKIEKHEIAEPEIAEVKTPEVKNQDNSEVKESVPEK